MRRVVHYFLKKFRKLPHVPRQYIAEYEVTTANYEQLRLMEAGKARTPQEAQRLLDKYGTKYAAIVIDLLPVRKTSLKQQIYSRLQSLVNRVEGSSRSNPVYRNSKNSSSDRVEITYFYRKRDKTNEI